MALQRIEKLVQSKEPTLTIGKNGVFYLNRMAIELLQVNFSKKEMEQLPNVDVFFDEDDDSNFFLGFSEKGLCRITNKNIKKGVLLSATFTLIEAQRKIFLSCSHDGSKALKAKILDKVDIENKTYYPIEIIKSSIKMILPKNQRYPFGQPTKIE